MFLLATLALADDPCSVLKPLLDGGGGRGWWNYASNSYPLQGLAVAQTERSATLTVGFAQTGAVDVDLPAGSVIEVALAGGTTASLVTTKRTPRAATVSSGRVTSVWRVELLLTPDTLRSLSSRVLEFRAEVAGQKVTVALNEFAQKKLGSALSCVASSVAPAP